MKICTVELPVDTGILTIGSAEPSGGEQPTLEELPAVTDSQIFVPCRQQMAPVRVEIWRGAVPATGHDLLSGELVLPAGYIAVGESFLRPCLSWPVCSPGQKVGIDIGVDDTVNASHVIITVDPSAPRIPMPRDRNVLIRSLADLEKLTDLDAVLAEHSFPAERLAASLRIIHHSAMKGTTAARLRYRVQLIIEWMRWLRAGISVVDLEGIDQAIMSVISSESLPERAAREILSEVAGALGLPLDELLVAR
jgi:hypothetical protein